MEILATELLGQMFQLRQFLSGHRHISIHQLLDECIYVSGIFRHASLQHTFSISLVAQQLCYLSSEVDNPGHQLTIVMLSTFTADGVLGHIHLASQFPVVGICEKGTVTGLMQGEEPSFHSLFLGCQGCGIQGCLRQASQLLLVGDMQTVGIGLLQTVLAELEADGVQLYSHPRQFLFVFIRETSASTLESIEDVVQQFLFLGIEPFFVLLYIFDALKEFPVEHYLIGMLGE